MKQKYSITIAGVQMNVVTDESPEAVEALVGLVDRKMGRAGGQKESHGLGVGCAEYGEADTVFLKKGVIPVLSGFQLLY